MNVQIFRTNVITTVGAPGQLIYSQFIIKNIVYKCIAQKLGTALVQNYYEQLLQTTMNYKIMTTND